MSTATPNHSAHGIGVPRMVRRVGLGVLGVLLASAAYLIMVRGEALVVDLATLGARIWCF